MSECATASPAFWPLSLRLAHWLSAALVLAGLGLGTIMVQFVHNPAVRFYALLVLMPVSGWFMATAMPVRVPTVVFGVFALPYPMAPDLAIYRAAHAAHVVLAILLSALIALHVVAAMVHALIWRDETLVRMCRIPGCFYRGSPSGSLQEAPPC